METAVVKMCDLGFRLIVIQSNDSEIQSNCAIRLHFDRRRLFFFTDSDCIDTVVMETKGHLSQ